MTRRGFPLPEVPSMINDEAGVTPGRNNDLRDLVDEVNKMLAAA